MKHFKVATRPNLTLVACQCKGELRFGARACEIACVIVHGGHGIPDVVCTCLNNSCEGPCLDQEIANDNGFVHSCECPFF